MPVEGSVVETDPTDEQRLAAWVERAVGGRVVRVERLQRWRSAWDVDVEVGGRVLPLHARGERESRQAMPYWIADERRTHDLLEAHGVPVPHVHGYCDEPYAMIMDRLPGFVDLSFADSDEQRAELNLAYLELLPRIYGIALDEARAAGFTIPSTAEQVALDLFTRFEAAHDGRMASPDPVCEFLRRWLHRNYPRNRTRVRFITYDAFQFMYEEGRVTGLIDFELAHVGDPVTEIAALRVRETIKNLGDLPAIAAAWSEVTGESLDHEAIVYHTVSYNANTVLSAAPLIEAPNVDGDVMSHYGWYVNSARWAFEDIADLLAVPLEPVAEPAAHSSRHAGMYRHLTAGLSNRGPSMSIDDHERAKLFRVARHLGRVDEIGGRLALDDLDDAAELLGHRPAPETLDAALVDFIGSAGPEHDGRLVRLLDRRVQRLHLLLGPPGSMLLRHPRLRSVRPDDAGRTGGAADDLPWTPGLIAGTR
jgi:aminoglycoside phosphotransferase (APT) family kinase protein